MPLYKRITIDATTNLFIWKIEEPYEVLNEGIVLTSHCRERVNSMKSEMHRRGFMSIRHLLAVAGYTDHDLYYDTHGKPHLRDGNQISITHSFEFSGIIVSDKPVGIDIEKQREKIQIIAHKFINAEKEFIKNHDHKTRALTVVWGAKESLYKLYATPGLSFEQHIKIRPFDLQLSFANGSIHFKNTINNYDIAFIEFEGFTCVYALPAQ